MVPTFSSQTDMINFLRALPENAKYTKMLAEDFGIVAPADADPVDAQYLWKYLVQGTYLGKSAIDLMKYAVEGVKKFRSEHPYVTAATLSNPKAVDSTISPKATNTAKPKKPGAVSKVSNGKQPDGTVMYLEHRGVWVGYWNGKIQCSKKTEDAARLFLANKFGE